MMKERFRNEIRELMIGIVVVGEDYASSEFQKKYPVSFVSLLNFVLNAEWNGNLFWDHVMQMHKNIKNLRDEKLIEKKDDYYVLTDNGWEIIGNFTRDAFMSIPRDKEYNFEICIFNKERFSSTNNADKKDELLEKYFQECKIIGEQDIWTIEAWNYMHDKEVLIRRLVNLSKMEHELNLDFQKNPDKYYNLFNSIQQIALKPNTNI